MVLYVAKRGPHNIGAITHKQALKDIYGAENLFEINLLSTEVVETENYISFGNDLSKFSDRISRYLEGNIPSISNQIIRRICEIIDARKVDLVFTEESDLGNLYKAIKKQFPNVKIICFFHDIVADLFSQRIKDTPKWKQHYILELKRAISQERVTTEVVDECWCFHRVDAERFRSHYSRTISTFIPLSNFVPSMDEMNLEVTEADSEKTILFVCSKYYVNIDGFRWFYAKVVPGLKGNYRIQLVGDGTKALMDLTVDKHISIVGEVDSMTDYYKAADIVIAPVFDGGGMKAKTIEAISFGKCFISTSESLNGYWECVPENIKGTLIYNCNTPEEWINACNKTIGSKICRFNQEIYKVFIADFSYESMVKKFRTALK
jgi:hypothetical protein